MAKPKTGAAPKGKAEVADTVAAGAIEGAGAALDAGGDAKDVAAATIGGAAAATSEALESDETVEETAEAPVSPAAPGDDPETVFQRRLDRLTALVEDAEFESGTALGDLVECVVDLFKHRPALWSAMSQSDQRDLIRHVEGICKKALAKVVLVVAQEESETIEATLLGQFAVKGEAIEAKLKIEHADAEVVLDVYKLAGHRVVLINADDKRFSAKRGPGPVTMPDQPALEFEREPNAIRTAPPGDADLAGEEPLFRVVDPEGEVNGDEATALYLEADGVAWTPDAAEAGGWPYDKARELADTAQADVEPVVNAEDPTPERTHDSESAVDDEDVGPQPES